MQLPGMNTDPVRMSLDVTWYPPSEDFAISRRLWTRPARSDAWQLEDLATTGSPVGLRELPGRWSTSSSASFGYFIDLVHNNLEPF